MSSEPTVERLGWLAYRVTIPAPLCGASLNWGHWAECHGPAATKACPYNDDEPRVLHFWTRWGANRAARRDRRRYFPVISGKPNTPEWQDVTEVFEYPWADPATLILDNTTRRYDPDLPPIRLCGAALNSNHWAECHGPNASRRCPYVDDHPPIPLADDTRSNVERESEITGGTETPPTPDYRKDRTMYNDDDTTTTTGPSHYTPPADPTREAQIIYDAYTASGDPWAAVNMAASILCHPANTDSAGSVQPGRDFRDGVIIRDPQPNDILIVTIDTRYTGDEVEQIVSGLEEETGCYVVAVVPGVNVQTFRQVGEDPPPPPPPPTDQPHDERCMCRACHPGQ